MNSTMELYTIAATAEDLKNDKISQEEYVLICSFIKARDKHYDEEEKMATYYKAKFSDRIDKATTKEQLREIKEELRTMPESVSKVFLFRHIIMMEDKIDGNVDGNI